METRNAPLFNGEDRISKLPDTLIHHILSFIDMKYAVQTSVLSRRWRYIWTSLPTLNFDDRLFVSPETEDDEIEEVHGFIDFVDRVLVLRESSDIERFQLVFDDIDGDNINSHLHTWILAAVRRNVQELLFEKFMDSPAFEIPHCLFTCKSLTKLEIVVSGVDYDIFLPSSISLPRLKFLRLVSLSFSDERSPDMLVSRCPSLESLIIESYKFNNVNLNISSLKLKRFELLCYDRGSNGKVKLYAPNLTFFLCRDFIFKDYSLENLSSLVTADILMDSTANDIVPENYRTELSAEKKELNAQRMMKILRALHNVKVLSLLSPWFVEVVSIAPEILDNQPTRFLNLQHLKLRTWFSRDCMDAIIYLLKISPNIESLCLQINEKHFYIPPMYPFCDEINFNSGSGEDYWDTGLSFPCMLYHLKLIEGRGILGCVNELKFLEILLKNAMVLEKVVLLSSTSEQNSSVTERRMKKFCDKLLSFPRASASIAILFRF